MFSINFFFANSNIGSIADWMMVFISIFTAVFLILNFKSQLIIQKAQLKVTAIENERYRNEILPRIKLSPKGIEFDHRTPVYTIAPNFEFIMEENACKKFTMIVLKHTDCSFTWPIDYIFTSPTLLKNDTVIFKPLITFTAETYENSKAIIYFEIKFYDFIDNYYRQDFIFSYSKGGYLIDRFAPELIS